MIRSSLAVLILVFAMCSVGTEAFCQDANPQLSAESPAKPAQTPKKAANQKAANQKKAKTQITGPQQAAVRRFVREHHPEILQLLKRLQKHRPGHYTVAMRSLLGELRRLNSIKKNNPERYDLALERWKVRSRIKLVSARIVIKDSPERQQELEELVAREIELRAEHLQYEETRMLQRLEKIKQQLGKLGTATSAERQTRIERDMKGAVRRSQRFLNLNKQTPKSAPQDRSEKPKSENEDESKETGDGLQ